MQEIIKIRGAREHNLKNVDLDLPRNKMIVFTGLSGSGKSSLAFDTIFAEGQRRYVESLSAYARQFLGGMQKPDVDEIEGLSPAISIDQKAHSANPRSTVATITEVYDYLRVLFARAGVPHCPICGEKIEKMTVDEIRDKAVEKLFEGEEKKSVEAKKKFALRELAILAPTVRGRKGEYYQMLYDQYNAGFAEARVDGKFHKLKDQIILEKNKKHDIEIVVDKIKFSEAANFTDDVDFKQRLSEAVETAVDLSNGLCVVVFPDKSEQIFSAEYSCARDGYSFPEIEPRLFSFNSPYGFCEACHGLGTESLFSEETCPVCEGKRLNNNALNVLIAGKNIWEVTSMTIAEAREYFTNFESHLTYKQKEISVPVLREIRNRLQFMFDVGLHYLTLNRRAGTLSGGEAQRIRLASQVGTRLVGALYVLDEPTIGLHQRDNEQLVNTLRNLCDIGNTIIVVEHDEDTILASDWLVDIGPAAGVHGGEIIFSGPLKDLLNGKSASAKKSLTGRYLRGEEKIPLPEKRRKVDVATPKIKIKGATEHNLKNLDAQIPLRRFVCLTGVSGSGKSTLMNDILHRGIMDRQLRRKKTKGNFTSLTGTEYIDTVIKIDQSPIGRSPRSNPVTYTQAFGHIRDLFASVPESKMRGFKSGRFSFNRPGGRCEHCEGRGVLEIEMHFLPSVEIECDVCHGTRFNKETLEVHFKNKNIAEVLNMTVAEAEEFFKDVPLVHDRLKMLNEVGLDYLTLGQSATTLSGGEAQRIKLSKELAKRSLGRSLYLLDEPTTGLHYEDVKKLIGVLQRLTDQGHSVLVIEHNLDLIKCADWIIDMGPDGGDKGGQIVAEGEPEYVARRAVSTTGHYLKKYVK